MKNKALGIRLITFITLLTGLLTLGTTLLALVHLHKARIVIADAHFTVIAGLSLVYLATLLRRAKYNAWLIAVPVYGFLIIRNIQHFVFEPKVDDEFLFSAVLNLAIPIAALCLLLIYRKSFNVRSELRNFTVALKRSAIILLAAFLYGSIGFQLFDQRDFRQEISAVQAAHYTIDQFGLTTTDQPMPHTKRSLLFVDSLAAVSLTSVFYAAVSLFAPIRFRLRHSQQDHKTIQALLHRYSTTSEDFFKLWPHDKTYFFNRTRTAALAYRVTSGVALVVGDPTGPKGSIKDLITGFQQYCHSNDWQIALIHTEGTHLTLYKKLGFNVQKLGEEALIDIDQFVDTIMISKYFRQIGNRFDKLGYEIQVHKPPHTKELLRDLQLISRDWLKAPGRAERGFMQGYFNYGYMQKCTILIARDAGGAAKAFINQVPSFKADEANYDFLRSAADCPGNINDYLMCGFFKQLHVEGLQRLNMGLSPLAGLESTTTEERTIMNSFLNFIYSNAGRLYSFTGLTRFKSKYNPTWEDRYIVYTGGARGLTKALRALVKAMKR